MTVSQLSVFIENKPGSLSAFTAHLRANGIDMRALSIADVEDYGILRIIVDDPVRTAEIVKGAAYVCRLTPVLAIPLKDSAGALDEVLNILGRNSINIEYLYAFVAREDNRAFVVFRVKDNDIVKAVAVLTASGHTPVNQQALKDLAG